MGALQRNRGAGYEREICSVLSAHFGIPLGRKLGQARDSGNDIDLGPLVIECKRRRSLAFGQWYAQAVKATPAGKIPAVIARQDGDLTSYIILSLPHFLSLAGPAIAQHLDLPAVPQTVGL